MYCATLGSLLAAGWVGTAGAVDGRGDAVGDAGKAIAAVEGVGDDVDDTLAGGTCALAQ